MSEKSLCEQAKTNFQIWELVQGIFDSHRCTVPDDVILWVPLSSVEEKAGVLRRLLENRPDLLKEPYTEMINHPEIDVFERYINDAETWFMRLEREFEAVFGKGKETEK